MINNLVITGIPRSGTSYACALLNSMDNTVIINEPQEIFHVLQNDSRHTIKRFYAATRNRIISREPIQNKIVNGKYVEDTNESDVRNYYIPEINDRSFVLGTKNTLVYLVCMRKILRQFSDAKILAFIRNPYDTISSWKKVSFPHLRNANPLFLGNYVGNAGKAEILTICRTDDQEARYALLWSYLAMQIINNIDNAIVFKYEEFVVDPVRHLAELYDSLGASARVTANIPASAARKHANALTPKETDCIREFCREPASYFGYNL